MTEIISNDPVHTEREAAIQPQSHDHTVAAQELLQNGILVETDRGLICISLKDALHQGVGGLTLSEDDFKNAAAELLLREEPEQVPVSNSNEQELIVRHDVNSMSDINSVRSMRTVLKRKFNNNRSILNKCFSGGPSTSKVLLSSALLWEENESEELDSIIVSDSGLSSDASEVISVPNPSAESSTVKRRGGWPKGRKRKPETKSEIRQPKAPATGYVIFLNEKRKEYKDLAFTEVTKLLGNEWSRLSLNDKRKYLDQAEIDKKRYREELKCYRQSDAYRQYLQRKRQKRIQGNGTEESDMDATDEIDEEDSEELYCRSCDQWFHSLHNKKEHLYGRQHLANISGRGKADDWQAAMSLDESSLDGCREESSDVRPLNLNSTNDTIVRFMAAYAEGNREKIFLKEKLIESKSKNRLLLTSLAEAKESIRKGSAALQSQRETQSQLEESISNLTNFPNNHE